MLIIDYIGSKLASFQQVVIYFCM